MQITKEWLVINYVNVSKSINSLAKELKIHHETIRRLLKRYNLPIKSKEIIQAGINNPFYGKKHTEETKKKMRGLRPQTAQEGNHNWKNHRDNRGYGWRERIRIKILERDKYKCQRCSINKNLVVHHIIAYAMTRDNSSENLITLCIKCHRIVHNSF